MAIKRMNVGRIPYIGAFALCTEKAALFPARLHFNEAEVKKALGVPVVKADVSQSFIIGVLAAGNSRGIICSELFDVEGDGLADLGINVGHVPGKFTAFGNLILANDSGALVHPDMPEDAVKVIEKNLGVDVQKGTIAGIKNVGAVGVATNKGVLLHPDVTEKELKAAEKALHVPADVGTACGGVKFIGICAVANSNGAVTGMTTTGPELGRIESSLGLI
jgi:translation initiation factor 6